MTAKTFLNQYQQSIITIKNLEAEAKQLEELALSCTIPTDREKIQASGLKDRIATLIVQATDLRFKIVDNRSEAIKKLQEVERVIACVKNKEQRQILHMRYIENKRWEEIATEMYFSYKWVCTLHGRALLEVEQIINR